MNLETSSVGGIQAGTRKLYLQKPPNRFPPVGELKGHHPFKSL